MKYKCLSIAEFDGSGVAQYFDFTAEKIAEKIMTDLSKDKSKFFMCSIGLIKYESLS